MGDRPPRRLLVTDELEAQSERLRAKRYAMTTDGPLQLSSAQLDAFRARLRERRVSGACRSA